MDILGIIPSRYGSTRFPGKPLAVIDGKSMIQRVYEQATLASSLSELIIATDDERIYDHAKQFSANVIMTSADHANGTSRCFEALTQTNHPFQAVINIQGDEPFIQPAQIDLVAQCLENENAEIATLVKKIDNYQDLANNTVVKVIVNKKAEALYFSRAPIPYINSPDKELLFEQFDFFKHIGVYGYRSAALAKLVKLPESTLEQLESLEQLRWLENGYSIKIKVTEMETISIDTQEDLNQINKNEF